MNWLAEKLGRDRLYDIDVILPNTNYFPDDYYAESKYVLRLLKRMCQYVRVDRELIKIKTFKDHELSRLARREKAAEEDKSRYYLWFRESLLDNPVELIGALVRELVKIRMRTDGLVSLDTGEVDSLAELATVCLGMGILAANTAPVLRRSEFADVPGWTAEWQGDVSGDMFGYALALFAWYRGELHAEWIQYLRNDVQLAFKSGFEYLKNTGDSIFKPIGYQGPQPA